MSDPTASVARDPSADLPRPPRGIELGARVLLALESTDAGIEVRLAGVDSRGAWFLALPIGCTLPVGEAVRCYVGEGQTMQCFHSRIARSRVQDGLPGTLVLEPPLSPASSRTAAAANSPAASPSGPSSHSSEVEAARRIAVEPVPPMRAVVRPPGRGRPATGEVVQLGAEAAIVHLRHPPTTSRMTLSLDPSEGFLRAKARELERSRPGTSHTLWRLQKVYSVYFAGIEAHLLDDPEDVACIETEDGQRWVCMVEFEDAHVGCADLVRFETEERIREEAMEALQVEQAEAARDALWRRALRSA